MKFLNNLKYFIAACLILSTAACDDFLDAELFDAIDAEAAFETIEDAEKVLLSVYDAYSSEQSSIIINTARTADYLKIGQGNRGQGISEYNWNYVPGDAPGVWGAAYRMIYNANDVLENLDGVEGEEAVKNRIRGEATALRALAHFDLVRLYGTSFNENPDALGVPYLFPPNNPEAEPARETVRAVYEFIVADLQEAKALLSNDNDVNDPSRLSEGAVDAAMARVMLHMGDYAQAETFATAAINNSGVSIATSGQYEDVFRDAGNPGVIFELNILINDFIIGNNFYELATGDNFFAPTNDLLDLYEPGDVRFDVNFSQLASGEFRVTKYSGKNGEENLADIKVFRIAEMYLIRAEARANTGNESGALDDLNTVRENRGLSDFSGGGSFLINEILDERGRELCFEGQRWLTLKRLGRDVSRMDCTASCLLPSTDTRFLWPIPQGEILANGNMIQNPGY